MHKLLLTMALSVILGTAQDKVVSDGFSFEVASVKASPPAASGAVRSPTSDPSLLSIRRATLNQLIRQAFELQDYQLEGGPKWADVDRFDIDGKSGTPATRRQMMAMLKTLLADRFGLVLHHETKPLLVSILGLAPGGPKFGAQFHRVEPGSSAGTDSVPKPAVDVVSLPNMSLQMFCLILRRNLRQDLETGQVAVGEVPPVIDRTELSGSFDIVLKLKGEDDWGSLLRGQLGLQLSQQKIPIDVTVVDSATKPTAN